MKFMKYLVATHVVRRKTCRLDYYLELPIKYYIIVGVLYMLLITINPPFNVIKRTLYSLPKISFFITLGINAMYLITDINKYHKMEQKISQVP